MNPAAFFLSLVLPAFGAFRVSRGAKTGEERGKCGGEWSGQWSAADETTGGRRGGEETETEQRAPAVQHGYRGGGYANRALKTYFIRSNNVVMPWDLLIFN